jgi:hypothetical protein
MYVAWLFMTLAAIWIVSTAQESLPDEIIGEQIFPGRRIQCIRCMADEATMAISLGIIGCTIFRTFLMLFLKYINPYSLRSKLLGLFCIALLVYNITYTDELGPTNPVLWSSCLVWLDNTVGFVAGMLIILMMVASVSQGMLGIELALAGLGFMTSVDSTPDVGRKMKVVTFPCSDKENKLRHSIYMHSKCVSEILAEVEVENLEKN